jgi:hypothetical protein
MTRKRFSSFLVLLASLFSASATHAAVPAPELSARFDMPASYGVPGVVLPAGSFSINVASHLGNRYIVHIDDQAGDVLATFLGLPSTRLPHPADGRISWTTANKGVIYLKGWYFPTASVGLEFVYPKAEAVAIAQANHTPVAAIDPASDGLLVAQPKDLSAKDLQVVTLWMLTPTRVGPQGAEGIKAQRYDQVASLDHKPALKALPHTASNLAWFYLLAALSLGGAAAMRLKALGPHA